MSSLDYLELCRLCLVKERVSVPIFEGEGDVRQIFLKIAACLPVKVNREDKLPKKICDDCVYKVELFYQFWNTTANAEKQLLQWLGEVNLEDKQGYVTNVVNPAGMKPDQNTKNRLDGTVMQQVDEQQNNMGIGMMENMGLGMPMMMPNTNQQQITSVPMDSSGNSVQTVQAVPGPSTQTAHSQIQQNQTSTTQQEEEEEESEEDDNSDDECDGDEGLPVKEEGEEDPNRTIEPTTFVNVSLACDEAGPSGLQQQKIPEMPEMAIPQTPDGDPKSGSRRTKARAVHECIKCAACFYHTRKLVEHLKNLHGIDRAFSCDECDKTFRSPMNIARHKLIHTGQRRFACDLCEYTSNQKSNLEQHRRRHARDYAYKCEICEKSFLLKTQYLEHINVHTRKKLFKCDYCIKAYPYKRNLTAHVKAQHANLLPAEKSQEEPEHKHICTLCLQSFRQKLLLDRHLKKQHQLKDTRKFLCDLCGKSLSSKRRLMVHTRGHLNEKSVICDLCGKAFSDKENLKIHERTHTGEKPYACSQCGRQFTQRTSLVLHLRCHSGERPFQCSDCGKGFITAFFLRKHRKIHEKDNLL